jgi:hypothetical protein
MSRVDRRWWLRVAGALVSTATALVFAVWFAVRLLPHDMSSVAASGSDIAASAAIDLLLLALAGRTVLRLTLARGHAEQLHGAIEAGQQLLPEAPIDLNADSERITGIVAATWHIGMWDVLLREVRYAACVEAAEPIKAVTAAVAAVPRPRSPSSSHP